MDSRRLEAFRVLGIPSDSDRAAVTRAYRRRARSVHPDVSTDPGAADRFAALAAAYRLARAVPEVRPDLPSGDRRAPRTTVSGWDDVGEGWRATSRRWLWESPSPGVRGQAWASPPIVAGPVVIRPSEAPDRSGEVRDG
jgi:hypothetical protein